MIDEEEVETMIEDANKPLTDDEALEYTKSVRLKAIGSMVGGEKVPTDKDDRKFLVNLLNGLDSQVLSKKRISADQDSAQSQAAAAATIAEVLKDRATQLVFVVAPNTPMDANRVTALGDDISSEFTALPGEMSVGASSETFDTFVDRMGGNLIVDEMKRIED